jgi:hypothetical protein
MCPEENVDPDQDAEIFLDFWRMRIDYPAW